MSEAEYEVVGTFEVDDDSDDTVYEKLNLSDDSESEDDETLEILLRNAKSHTNEVHNQVKDVIPDDMSNDMIENADCYVRDFLTTMRLHDTLNEFQAEWYRLEATGGLQKDKIGKIPLMYLEYHGLDAKLRKLEQNVDRMKDTAVKVQKTWAKLKIDRDGYKLAHMRVGHEKHATLENIKSLVQQTKKKLPSLDDLNQKIESADKDRMLLDLEVQRLRQLHERLLASQPKPETKEKSKSSEKADKDSEKNSERQPVLTAAAVLPSTQVLNPHSNIEKRANIEGINQRIVTKASKSPISAVAVHPKRRVYATAGDDAVWHLWNADTKELLISGKGHNGWISSCAFHPRGAHLATASSDGTTRIWDFMSSKCALELQGSLDVVWSCDFHHGGRVIATSGSDSTIRLYDLQGGQNLSIMRGHDRDINCVRWSPFTNTLVSGGADHLVGLWDAREGAMVNRGSGHQSAVFGVATSANGRFFASGDGKGEVRFWDIRKMESLFTTKLSSSVNAVALDTTGSFIFAGCADGKAQVILTDSPHTSWTMASFEASCDSIAVNYDTDMVVCGAMDGNVAVCTSG